MNQKSKNLTVYEGIACSSLLCCIASSLYTFSKLKSYYQFTQAGLIPISSIESHKDQYVQLAGKIRTSSECVFKYTIQTQSAIFDFANHEKLFYYEDFYIDKHKKLLISPTEYTYWILPHRYSYTFYGFLAKTFQLLTFFIHLPRYFFGLRFNAGEFSGESKLVNGDKVFVCGFVSIIAGNAVLKPEFVATCKDSVAKRIFGDIAPTLIVIAACATVLGFCWSKIKKIEREKEGHAKFVAVGNMKCVVCEERIIEIVVSPCNHLCLCFDCCGRVEECPMCGQRTEGFQRVYHG